MGPLAIKAELPTLWTTSIILAFDKWKRFKEQKSKALS